MKQNKKVATNAILTLEIFKEVTRKVLKQHDK